MPTWSHFGHYLIHSSIPLWSSKGHGQWVMVMNDWLTWVTSLSFNFNLPSNSWDMVIYFKISPWNSKVKVMHVVKGHGDTVGSATNRFTSFLFHMNRLHRWSQLRPRVGGGGSFWPNSTLFSKANDKIWANFDQFHAKLLQKWLIWWHFLLSRVWFWPIFRCLGYDFGPRSPYPWV